MKSNIYLACLVAILILAAISNSGDKALSNPEKKIIKMVVTAEHLAGDEKAKFIKLWDNVAIEQGGMLVTAKSATYDMETKIFELSGGVSFTRPGTLITGDRVVIQQEKQSGFWGGHVKLVQQKVSEGKSENKMGNFLKDGPVVITCKKLEFYWGNTIKAIARDNVEAFQKDKHLYSDTATYTEKPQRLLLEGNIKLESGAGAKFKCDKLELDIKEEKILAQGINTQGGSVQIQIPLKLIKKQ